MPAKPLIAALSLAFGLILPSLADAAPPAAAARRNAAAQGTEDRYATGILQYLVGEFALRNGDFPTASDILGDLAQRTRDPQIVARAAEAAAEARQTDRALQLSQLWLNIEPDSTQARQLRTSLLILGNRTEELAPQIANLLAVDRENLAGNLVHLNRMLARLNNPAAAMKIVERVTHPYDDIPEAHFALAEAASNAGDLQRAIDETGKALALRPDWEGVALVRAQIQARLSGSLALAGLRDFVERNPHAREARLALARLLVAEKRYSDARQQFEKLLQDNPEAPEIIYPVAVLALQQGDFQTGRQQLEHLLSTDYRDKPGIHFLLGQLDQEQQKPEAALAHFLEVTGGEQYLAARSRAAQILMQLGRSDEGLKLLRSSTSTTPEQRVMLIQAEAQILREAERYQEAYDVLRTGLTTRPDDLDLLYDTALMAERLGDLTEMERLLRKLLTLKPEHAHALNALGFSLAERNIRLDEAQKLITRALEITPEDPFILDSLGWVLFRQGQPGEALQTLERAYRMKADPEIAAHLGEVLWSLGRQDEARRLINEALQANPGHRVLSETRDRLRP